MFQIIFNESLILDYHKVLESPIHLPVISWGPFPILSNLMFKVKPDLLRPFEWQHTEQTNWFLIFLVISEWHDMVLNLTAGNTNKYSRILFHIENKDHWGKESPNMKTLVILMDNCHLRRNFSFGDVLNSLCDYMPVKRNTKSLKHEYCWYIYQNTFIYT